MQHVALNLQLTCHKHTLKTVKLGLNGDGLSLFFSVMLYKHNTENYTLLESLLIMGQKYSNIIIKVCCYIAHILKLQ